MAGGSVRTLMVTASLVVLAATGASAYDGPGARPAVCRADGQAGPGTAGSGAVPERQAGLAVSVIAGDSGGVLVKASGHGLEIRKLVARDGSFTMTIAAPGDAVAVAGTSRDVVVTRGRQSVRVDAAEAKAESFAKAASLLAGSTALRTFRGAVAAMDPSTRETVGGAALEIGDVLLRVLQDDAGAVDRWRHGRGERTRGFVRAAFGLRAPCFEAWETEVLEAWDWYEGCYHDFSWWSGGREACAFVYVLRVEAAWFQFLTCVGFKAQ